MPPAYRGLVSEQSGYRDKASPLYVAIVSIGPLSVLFVAQSPACQRCGSHGSPSTLIFRE